jgi:hypothetical protein
LFRFSRVGLVRLAIRVSPYGSRLKRTAKQQTVLSWRHASCSKQ